MGMIRLKNMIFYGYHGVASQEKELGSRFEVDLEMNLDLSKAALSDRLRDTVNYEEVYQTVESIMVNSKFYLIEKLAAKIAEEISDTFPVNQVTVRIRKPSVPIKGVIDHVEVELTRKNESIH